MMDEIREDANRVPILLTDREIEHLKGHAYAGSVEDRYGTAKAIVDYMSYTDPKGNEDKEAVFKQRRAVLLRVVPDLMARGEREKLEVASYVCVVVQRLNELLVKKGMFEHQIEDFRGLFVSAMEILMELHRAYLQKKQMKIPI